MLNVEPFRLELIHLFHIIRTVWGLLSKEAGKTGVGVTVAVTVAEFLGKQNLKYGMLE